MKAFVFLLCFLMMAIAQKASAQSAVGCSPDPLTWPQICRPEAPGQAAKCMTISPQSEDIAGGYWHGLPFDFVYAMRHAEHTQQFTWLAYQAHRDGLIDYKQLNDAVKYVAANPPRPGQYGEQTEVGKVLINGIQVDVAIPVYEELRFTPIPWPYGNLTVNSPRNLRVLRLLYNIEWITRHRGWAFPGETGELYSAGGNATVDSHIKNYYNGYGFAPEVLQYVYDLWLPAPAAGLCQVPN